MIDHEIFKRAVESAFVQARQFVDTYGLRPPERDFLPFKGCCIPGCSPNHVLQFLQENGVSVVPMRLNHDKYASWLMPLATTSIAVDMEQLKKWFEVTEMPIGAQFSRVLIHELAHKLLHERLIAREGRYRGRQDIVTSGDLEEEEAWVFTFTFFAIAAGDYSVISRRRDDGDNTPSRFI